MPTQPVGEASQSWRKLIGLVVSNAGVGFTLSKIGMKRRDNEQNETGRVAQRNDELGNRDAGHLDDHVGRKRLAAIVVGRSVVEPAFRSDIDPGKAEPEQDTQDRPGRRVSQCGIQHQNARDDRAQGCKHPHVPDTADQQRCDP